MDTDRVGSRMAPADFVVADSQMSADEALEFLSDAERAALNDEDPGDGTDDAQADASEPDGGGETQDEGQSDEDDGRESGSEAAGQQQDGDAEVAVEQAGDDQQTPAEEGHDQDGLTDPFVPQYSFDAGDLAARQAKLDTDFKNAKTIIDKAYEDGEIDEKDYNARRDLLWELRAKEQSKIDRDTVKADIAREQAEQTKSQTWDHALARFMAANKEIRNSRVLSGAMQAELNAIGAETAGQPMSYTAMLNLAKERVYKELGKTPAAPKAEAKRDPVKELVKQRGAKPAIPKTLGDVPADRLSSEKFDDIDSLSGLAYEDAIARMTSDEVNRWSQAHR